MSLARLKRLAALEAIAAKRRPTRPYFDPFPACLLLMVDLEAVAKSRACWVPRPERELSEEQADALDRAIRTADSMHDRLTAEHKAAEQAKREARLAHRAQRRAEAAAMASPASALQARTAGRTRASGSGSYCA
jgi:hypothetical protein